MSSVADVYYIKFGSNIGLFRISFADSLDKPVYRIIFHNADRAAAEAAAGNAGAKDAGDVPCQFCQKVCLFAGSLIIVPKRDMGFIDELSESFDVIGLQSFHRMNGALVLVDCVFCTFPADRILDCVFVLLELLFGQIAQGLDINNGLECF